MLVWGRVGGFWRSRWVSLVNGVKPIQTSGTHLFPTKLSIQSPHMVFTMSGVYQKQQTLGVGEVSKIYNLSRW